MLARRGSPDPGEFVSLALWRDNTVQVLYDVPNQRIQVWSSDPQTGWMQQGKDIPVEFASGDQFRVRVGKDGTVEIYRNGKLLAREN